MKHSDRESGTTIGPDGYFQRQGRHVMPVGVNYWPASCGVDMWQAWPEKEMQHDLDVVRDLGLNCVRFFLRWPDFEPELGRYDATMFERLRQFMGWCAERELLAHPALVTGFMSGGFFWPKGKEQRNLYTDPTMVKHSAELCRRAAAVLAPFHSTMLAIDLGNELGCADAWGTSPAAIRRWCEAVTSAIREEYPHALIVSGLDSGQVIHDSGWRLGEQPGTDFYSVHTYPVPTWNVVPFDGMTDPFCQAILPFNTLAARSFGPVMVQEFSSILTCGKPECESYLKAILPACRDHGANGFLWWCLRDVQARIHPYVKSGFEGRLGLVDAADRVKPSLACVVDFFRSLADWTPPERRATEIGIYWPREYYRQENERNPGNEPSALWRRMFAAHYLLTRLGHKVGIVRGDRPFEPALKTLVITGAALTTTEAEQLEAWVRQGGRVIWSSPGWAQWTPGYDAMGGAQPVDIRAGTPASIDCFGQRWDLAHFAPDGRVDVRVTSASVLAAAGDGRPILLSNRLGKGQVVCALPMVEDSVIAVATDRAARDRWRAFYAGLMREVGHPGASQER